MADLVSADVDPLLKLEAEEEVAWCASLSGDNTRAINGLRRVIDSLDLLDGHDERKTQASWRLGKTLWDQKWWAVQYIHSSLVTDAVLGYDFLKRSIGSRPTAFLSRLPSDVPRLLRLSSHSEYAIPSLLIHPTLQELPSVSRKP